MSNAENNVLNFTANIDGSSKTLPSRTSQINPAQGRYPIDLHSPIANAIDRLLVESCEPMNEGSAEAEELEEDVKRLKSITGTIRGIVKEGAYLLGMQINEAKEILKKHKDSERTFSEWM